MLVDICNRLSSPRLSVSAVNNPRNYPKNVFQISVTM